MNNLPSTIILIRHGETVKNKSENRVLDKRYVSRLIKHSKKMSKFIKNKSCLILSDTVRSVETANYLFYDNYFEPILIEELRIKGIDKFIKLHKNLDHNTQIDHYLNNKNRSLEKLKVETKEEITKRYLKLLRKQKASRVTIIGHSGALEAFLYTQDDYEIKYKTFKKYFDYSDFVVLVIKT